MEFSDLKCPGEGLGEKFFLECNINFKWEGNILKDMAVEINANKSK